MIDRCIVGAGVKWRHLIMVRSRVSNVVRVVLVIGAFQQRKHCVQCTGCSTVRAQLGKSIRLQAVTSMQLVTWYSGSLHDHFDPPCTWWCQRCTASNTVQVSRIFTEIVHAWQGLEQLLQQRLRLQTMLLPPPLLHHQVPRLSFPLNLTTRVYLHVKSCKGWHL